MIKDKLIVRDTVIRITKALEEDYISLTDIAKYKSDEPNAVILNWMRNKNTIEFLGLWEQLNNLDFKPLEFEGFRKEAGGNAFTLSPTKWIKTTNAIGIISKSGRYGGTYAHKDIAFEFASWISPEFKLYLIKEFQRLKEEELERQKLGWNVNREIAKINYTIHTDAIKEHLIDDKSQNKWKNNLTYANEADMLNLVVFGKTAKEWREENPNRKGNIRDYASVEELIILSNLEAFNADLIKRGMDKRDRFERLREVAKQQFTSLLKRGKNRLLN
jgi:hypothetical protein